MYLDSQGNLWLGHRAMGISKFRPDQNTFELLTLPDGYQHISIRDIIEDDHGCIWFSTEKNGLLKFSNNNWQYFRKSNGLPTESLDALCWTGQELWIGSDQGILVYNPTLPDREAFRFLTDKNEIKFTNVAALQKDFVGNIWIGDTEKGIFKFISSENLEQPEQFINISKLYKLPSKNIQCIMSDFKRKIWIGTENQGIVRYTPPVLAYKKGQFDIIDEKNGLEKRSITSLFQDREGSYWIGTDGGGVFQYRGECFEKYCALFRHCRQYERT